MLEEDDERIALTDIEFGQEGIPHLVVFPMDNKAKAALKYLQANFTEGEFTFAVGGYDGENTDYEDEEDDELFEFENSAELARVRELFEELMPRKEEIESLYRQHFGLAIVNFPMPDFDNLPFAIGEPPFTFGEEVDLLLVELLDRQEELDYDDADEFINEIKEMAGNYPQVPAFWFIAADVYCDDERDEEAVNLLKEKFADFSDVFYFVAKQMLILTDKDKQHEILALGKQYYPRLAQFAVNGELDKDELIDFFVTLCGAIAPMQMAADAETCLAWLKYLDGPHILIQTQEMCVLSIKYQKLVDKGLIAPAL